MSIDWNVILWCCITNMVLVIGFVIMYYVVSARAVNKRKEAVKETIESIVPGREVICAGGIKGVIQKVEDEFVEVKIADNVTITVAYYSISQVLEKKRTISKEKIAKKKAEQ